MQSEVMKLAWNFKKNYKSVDKKEFKFSSCLKAAWYLVKKTVQADKVKYYITNNNAYAAIYTPYLYTVNYGILDTIKNEIKENKKINNEWNLNDVTWNPDLQITEDNKDNFNNILEKLQKESCAILGHPERQESIAAAVNSLESIYIKARKEDKTITSNTYRWFKMCIENIKLNFR